MNKMRIATDGIFFCIEEEIEYQGFLGFGKRTEWRTYGDEWTPQIFYDSREAAQKYMDTLQKRHEWVPC